MKQNVISRGTQNGHSVEDTIALLHQAEDTAVSSRPSLEMKRRDAEADGAHATKREESFERPAHFSDGSVPYLNRLRAHVFNLVT